MKKKLFSLLTALVLCLLCAVPAFAEMPLVMDTYELFKPEATAELEQKAQDASAGHGVNVYLLTVSDIGGQNVREFAKDWYRDYDLGYGEGKSGILFLIALDSRDYVTITYGGGVTAFTDYRIAQIEDKIVPMLSDGTYYKASDTYIEMCADTLDFYAEKGAPLDSGNDPAKETESLTRLIDAGVDGLVVNTCGGNDEAIAAAAGRLPVVLLDRDVADGGIDLVTSNNRELVAGLVDELAAAGCERLCLLTEASDDSPVRRERAEAFADELSRRGLAGEVVTLADGGATGVGRLDETMRDYAGKKLGLIAVNGLVFLRLTEALAQLGPSLPAGLRIATFDDYPWNHVLFGGVTTAAQDTLTIAERVVERLSERIDVVTTTVGEAAKLAPKRIEIPGHIEHRASTSR